MRLPSLRSKNRTADDTERPPRAERARKAPVLLDEAAAVAAARTRARRRLIGALVLLAVGVVGFPVLFETEPRPLPSDTPIDVVRRDTPTAAADTPLPARPGPALPGDAGVDVATGPLPAAPDEGLGDTETVLEPAPPAAAASDESALPASAARRGPLSAPAPVPAGAASRPAGAASRPAPTITARNSEGERALALLRGGDAPPRSQAQPPSASVTGPPSVSASASATAPAAQTGRFIVQVGAYNDPVALREARSRVEGLGLKTYIQVVETGAGRRTRVRVGPYSSRDEADAAAARVRRSGLQVLVIAL